MAAILQLHPSTVSTQLRPLDEQGFIQRKVDEVDRRVTLIFVTRAGRAVCQRVRATGAEAWHVILESWSASDRHLLAQLLDRARLDTQAAIRAAVAEDPALDPTSGALIK